MNPNHPRKPAEQVLSRPLQQQRTWQAPKGRKVYRPIAAQHNGEGTSGTKDSLGREIHSPATHPENNEPSPEKDHVLEPANNKEVSNTSDLDHASEPVTISNSFAALETYDDHPPSGEEQINIPAALSPGSGIHRAEELPHARYESTDNLVQKGSACEREASPVNSPFSPVQEASSPAHVQALAQVPHSQVMDMQLHMHDNVFLFPPDPPLLTYGDPDEEEEENYDNQHTVVTYGSDSEVVVKAKKAVPPLSILT
ncbi:hypothetical protein FRX31_015958, partial [Thalictrum thalictroides]